MNLNNESERCFTWHDIWWWTYRRWPVWRGAIRKGRNQLKKLLMHCLCLFLHIGNVVDHFDTRLNLARSGSATHGMGAKTIPGMIWKPVAIPHHIPWAECWFLHDEIIFWFCLCPAVPPQKYGFCAVFWINTQRKIRAFKRLIINDYRVNSPILSRVSGGKPPSGAGLRWRSMMA